MQKFLKPFQIFDSNSACIWLNGDPNSIGKRGESIWNLARFRIATDGAIGEIFKRCGHVEWPNVICGDFDSIQKDVDSRNAEVIHLPDQDKTDLTKSIELCLERRSTGKWQFDKIVILGGLNGRFDHTMSTLSTLATFVDEVIPLFVLDVNNLVVAVPEGQTEIEIDLSKTSKMCGVIPLAQQPTNVSSNGLKYEMTDLPLAFGKLISTSNEVISNRLLLTSTSTLLFTIELLNKCE